MLHTCKQVSGLEGSERFERCLSQPTFFLGCVHEVGLVCLPAGVTAGREETRRLFYFFIFFLFFPIFYFFLLDLPGHETR